MGFGLGLEEDLFCFDWACSEQAFIAFYALRVYRSVEQRFLPMSLVYVGIVEYYSGKTVLHHMFSW